MATDFNAKYGLSRQMLVKSVDMAQVLSAEVEPRERYEAKEKLKYLDSAQLEGNYEKTSSPFPITLALGSDGRHFLSR
jgi:hypothetical protein